MALRQHDLKNTMLKKISLDEFTPKTGETKDVMVVGFHIHEQQETTGWKMQQYLELKIVLKKVQEPRQRRKPMLRSREVQRKAMQLTY